jgi:hypothetical protein
MAIKQAPKKIYIYIIDEDVSSKNLMTGFLKNCMKKNKK